jgi:Flp pilus assembly protein TadD
MGRFAEAESSFQEALRLEPRSVEAHNNLASCWKEQGRLEEALAGYQLALWLGRTRGRIYLSSPVEMAQ